MRLNECQKLNEALVENEMERTQRERGIKQKGKHALLHESVLERRVRETHAITTQCGAYAWSNKSYNDG